MKKIFTILGTMIIIGNSVSTVIIINSDKNEQVKNLKNSKIHFEKNKLEKPNRIKRQITPLPLYWHSNPGPSRINISNVIASVNLGILSNNDQATILERISEQNPNLDTTQIQINFTRFNEDGTQLWTISVRENSQMYFGEQNVRFSIRSNLCDFLSQQDLANVLLIPLCTVIKNTNLGVLPNEKRETILQRIAEENPNLDITQVVAHFIRIDDNGTFIWIIAPSENSIYTSVIQVYFRINHTLMINHIQIPEININVEKQKKLNKINFEPLSENEKRSFKETLQRIGTAAIRAGIIPDKAKITANVMPPVNANYELGAKEIITSSLISTAGLAAVSKTTGLSPINGLKTIANYFRYNLVSPPLETTAETAQAAELAPLLSSG
ncbi:hypothetical protein [Spiroplasma endosymbiont of Sarcophaga carnaria]|uniref:hypothetical protein n=1 Tax=Spiroplasma endosymbiont of Sarcophaga carnaria TaxID=3066303 RepID=UPI0030D3667D